jgi:hypothetical protein
MGAAAFFQKHWREEFRTSCLGPWRNSWLLLAISAFAGVLTLQQPIYVWIMFPCMAQLLMANISMGVVELILPFIYLLPEKATSKILWTNLTYIIKSLGECFLISLLSIFLFRTDVITVIMVSSAYLSATFLSIITVYCFRCNRKESHTKRQTSWRESWWVVMLILPGIVAMIFTGVISPEIKPYVLVGTYAIWIFVEGALIGLTLPKRLHRLEMPVPEVRLVIQ